MAAEFSGKGHLWVTDPTQELPIRLRDSGSGSEPPVTVMTRFKHNVEHFGQKTAIAIKREGKWVNWTWESFYNDTLRIAAALVHVGVEEAQGVGIIGFNSPEWFLADLGAIAAGAIAAGIYTTNGPDACHYVAEHCDAGVVFVENEQQLKKFIAIRERLPKLKALVQWGGKVSADVKDLYSFEDFIKLGDAKDQEEVRRRIEASRPGKCCTLIYTSGTTGPPKAVMISNDNLTWTSNLVVHQLNIGADDAIISYLPLSHIAAQMLDIHGPMACGATVYFAQPDALKGSLVDTLREVRPTCFLGVPRVWEKMEEKMRETGRKTTGIKKTIAEWAKAKGLEGSYAEQRGEDKPWGFFFANKLVFEKVKEALGLDRVRFCATAAAPIARETLDYFMSLYIPIYEIYGMSECSGPQTVNVPGKHKTGTAGPALPGCEMKIQDPDAQGNGEIVYRGRHIFMGYMKNDKATAETIDEEGFLHSGDIGKVDGDGFLAITGRIKELIITAGGENIPPVLIEDEIKKELQDVISNVMVIGDRRKFLTCTITLKAVPKKDPNANEYPFTDDLAPSCKSVFSAQGSGAATVQQAASDEAVKKYIHQGIEKANQKAASNAQRIGKFIILPQDFTIEGNELTPTMKLKRRIVVEKYSADIEKMYEEAANQ